MATMMKHVGIYGEKPCVVVFRALPEEPTSALICISNGLEGSLHDDVMSVVDSPEGQNSNEISEVFFRRRLSDGENMLEALHSRKKLLKVPVAMVKLTPLPNQQVELAEINKQLSQITSGSNPALKTEAALNPIAESQVANIAPVEADNSPEGIAKSLIAQSELIEADANAMLSDAQAKLAQAYEMAPDLKPKRGPGRPPKTDTV
tara:strand:- start:6331 stop:6945 length:615 start_codon:yes stop_codon:yes gene_type:complete